MYERILWVSDCVEENLQEISVVTCFLEHDEKILILRRSEKVGTYRGKWAGVSGYIEPDETPHQTAMKELFEETNLTPGDVELIKRGEVLQVPDRKRDTLWKVHPYLFRVRNPDKIEVDWEHREARWIEPKDIGKYKTVPKLKETLERVYT